MAYLVPSLVTLRAEFDKIAPGRDKSSDGWIGDAAHQGGTSDHNPDAKGAVHAIDVDEDLREGFTMMDCVNYLLSELRKSGESGKDRGRLKYLIYERKIYEAPNWEKRDYAGANPHDKHLHVSAEYATKYEGDTHPYGLIDKFGDDLPMEQAEFNRLMDGWAGTANGKRALCSANHEDTVMMTGDDGEILPDAGADSRMAPDTALKNINQQVIQIKNLLLP